MALIVFSKLNDSAQLPTRANISDTGYDLVATSINVTDDYIEYGTGLAITTVSPHLEIGLRPRSSVSKYDLVLANGPGTIDVGYRDEIRVRFKRVLSPSQILDMVRAGKKAEIPDGKIYNVGDRIAQLVFLTQVHPKVSAEEQRVVSDNDSTTAPDFVINRGGGFGSTGN
jgi:dUTPase